MLNDLIVSTAATIIGGIVVTYLHLYLLRRDSKLGHKQLIYEIKHRVHRPTLVVFVYALAMLQVAWNVFTLALITLGENMWLRNAYIADVPLMVFMLLLVMGVVMVPISLFMHHRLPKSRLDLNIALVVVTYTLGVIEASLIAGNFPTLDDTAVMLFVLAVTGCILLPALYLGVYLAKKTQQQFVMEQLFKWLPERDQKDLIELVDSLPSLAGKGSGRQK